MVRKLTDIVYMICLRFDLGVWKQTILIVDR